MRIAFVVYVRLCVSAVMVKNIRRFGGPRLGLLLWATFFFFLDVALWLMRMYAQLFGALLC